MRHSVLMGAAGALLVLLLGLPSVAPAEGEPAPYRVEREGIAIDLAIEPLDSDSELREGQNVAFRFTITDTATGTPLSGVYPAAWMDPVPDGEPAGPGRCVKMVEEFVGGSLLAQAELDLNVYHVLALNQDATLTVVDPLFGFGGTKLLALVSLLSPGEDWVLAADRSRLFVSQPDAGRVAVIDTAAWEVTTHLDAGPRPRRLALQGDGAYLWAGIEGDGPESGVAVIDARSLEVVARIATGRGRHEIALSDDHRLAWVTNSADDTVSVVDVRSLGKVRDLETGAEPIAIAYSELARAAYVSHRGDGKIVVVDGRSGTIRARLQAEPGLGQIRFAPGGRLGFAVNPERDTLSIVDAARDRVVQTGDMLRGPDQVAFSDHLAYVRHRDSEIVLMVPLDEVGDEGKPIPVVDFPGGQEPFGRGVRPSPADVIVQAPGATAVLVANPADRMIYYYKEGMAAPMGGFRNYDRQPRAVMVVDRSLRELRQPGVYETVAKLRRPGRYQVAFFLDAPRIVHCFEAEVAASPELERQRRAARPVAVEPLFESREVRVGETLQLRYRLTEPNTGEPLTGLADVQVLAYTAGNWNRRQAAEDRGDGIYEITFVPPGPATFIFVVQCPSWRLPFNLSPQRTLRAVAAPSEPAEAGIR